MIDFRLLYKAIDYYKLKGYTHIEVPWVVDYTTLAITFPKGMKCPSSNLVASGEQSFLQLIKDKKLELGAYCCITPCYRPNDAEDELHQHQFYKVELIKYASEDEPADYNLVSMMEVAAAFMEEQRGQKVHYKKITDEPREGCISFNAWDIVTKDGIELGSYGMRWAKEIGYWVYGTGAALPRLQYGLK